MKRHWMKQLVFCLFVGMATSAFAQEPQQENQNERKKREIPSPENNAKRITREFKQTFKLSDEQYDKVYELYLKQEKDMMPSTSGNGDMSAGGRGMGRPPQGGMGGPGGGMGGGMGMPPQGGGRPEMGGDAPEDLKKQMEKMREEQEKKREKAAKTLTKKMKKILKGEQFTQWQEWETERMNKSQRPQQPEGRPQGEAPQGF